MKLEAKINDVFSNISPPSPSNIVIEDDWDSESIQMDLANFLAVGVNVDYSILEKNCKSLPAFTPDAFVFFIKYYMLYALIYPSSELTDNLIYRLSDLDITTEYWSQRVKLLTNDQILLIVDFLFYVRNKISENEKFLEKKIDEAIFLWSSLIPVADN